MRIDGDWVKAEGTTLGADNGIGVPAIMAILAADDIPHPAIEALFTVDEESGMTVTHSNAYQGGENEESEALTYHLLEGSAGHFLERLGECPD